MTDMDSTELTITAADVLRWQNERRTAEPPVITFGSWEPIYGPERTRLLATADSGGLFPTVTEWTLHKDEPVTGYRRQRRERWYDLSGRLLGRWEWQYAGIDMIPLSESRLDRR